MSTSYSLLSSLSLVQQSYVPDEVLVDPSFFMVILAGVILALAFQFVLTIISVAVGVTSIGDLKKSFVAAQVQQEHPEHKLHSDQDSNDDDSDSSMGVKITAGFGIWSLITTALSLFFASWLAFNLNIVESTGTNVTIALVIWSLFFLILFYLEAKMARTLVGSLITAATSGLKASAGAVGSLFSTSKEKRVERVIDSTIDRVRAEVDAGVDTEKIANVLDDFLNRLDQRIPDLTNLKSDLEDIAKKSRSKNLSGKWMAVQQVVNTAIDKNEKSGDPDKKKKATQLKELVNKISTEMDNSSNKTEGVKNILESFTSVERDEINHRHRQIEDYLGKAKEKDLTSSSLKESLQPYINDPSMVRSLVEDNFSSLDRQKIIETLDKNTNIERDQLEKHADTVDEFIRKAAREFDKENEDRLTKRVEGRVADFFDGTGKPELNYAVLKQDVKRILDNPKDSLNILQSRLQTFDKDTVRALVTNNRHVNDEHIDKVVETIEKSRTEVEDKVNLIQRKSRERIELLKRKAVIRAEHARKTAIAAAWWLVASAIISGVAAVAGGIAAL
ncbi:hypothetical protein PP178_14110 [Zeaxanthinibacter sp. PT1]|uniref:hypothetical protein n=1 Tax=Zeaxanthinibacter TaxID=561554 RepID=UPI0023493347|nr:hypothetical protein [Zeaxanthinibacter sp. PT1]MDC6352692.1 hypothetical protein [Zeaxanthinibacter sp. PT1]